MECVAILVLLLLGAIFAGAANPFSRRAGERNVRVWRRVAKTFGGVYTGSGFLSRPTLHFRYGAAKAVLSGRRGLTRLEIVWPDRKLNGVILSRGFSRISGGLPLGLPAFDASFTLIPAPGSELPATISEGVCAMLEHLRLLRGGAVQVLLASGKLTVVKQAELRTENDLIRFARLSCGLYDQLLLTRAEGIEFVEASAPGDSEARCQVCGESIRSHRVECRRCRTPHHRECWAYFGSCTVYGCDEREFDVAEPLDPPKGGELRCAPE